MTTSSLPPIAPADVHAVLARHILADGFDLPTPQMRKTMHERLFAGGLLVLTCGVRSHRFRPPLNLTAAEADTALEIVRKSLKEL